MNQSKGKKPRRKCNWRHKDTASPHHSCQTLPLLRESPARLAFRGCCWWPLSERGGVGCGVWPGTTALTALAAWCAPCAAFAKQKSAPRGLTPASERLVHAVSFLSSLRLEKPRPHCTLLKLIGISAKCTT